MPHTTRRQILSFIGGAAAVTLVGCFRESSDAVESAALSVPGCVVKPQQTEGPYFVDERLNRSDIRSNPTDGVIKSGVPLRLIFQVSQVSGTVCQPLSGATIDVWHCDAEGAYSDVQQTQGQKFLRGYQTTDSSGNAQFVTIYPGWYPGRTVHIHFKIRGSSAAQAGYEFTSQLYFDDALTDRIYTQAPYSTRGPRSVRNDRDGIFRDGGEQLVLPVTQSGAGYEGRFSIGLEQT